MDVKRESRKARGVSRSAASQQAPADHIEPPKAKGKSAWKHDLHRAFARVRMELAPMQVHVWEIMWDHLPAANSPFRLSHSTIAREGGIHRTAAARAAAELERLGLLVCIARGRLGSMDANVWRFPDTLPEVPRRSRRPRPKAAAS
jgi:hypothetical protein